MKVKKGRIFLSGYYIINMIVKSINDTEKSNNSNFLSIFNRAFKYDYKDIVKELRDRLIFKNICYDL